MKEIICTAMFIVLAGCAPVISGGQAEDSVAEGWYSPEKTDLQLSQDLKECQTRCASA